MKRSRGVRTVYEELSFPDAAEMAVKARLAMKVAEALLVRGWTQQESARVLGMSQPKLSKMLRGEFRGVSEMKMMDCLVRLWHGVKIVVGPAGKRAAKGVEVVAA